ncbi:MAG: D-2-hydroxyacid dehydrogenase [Oscillospiraceae bacterium]|nr:D-2-hydroxyacid dehydrogenase [Oscillospiraceae bacterium]
MKIAVLEEKTVVGGSDSVNFDEIRSLGDTVCYPLTPADKIVEYIGDAEAVLCNKTVFTREIMEACPNLKYIGICATGYNNIDVTAAAELGITVCNCPSYSTGAVAQQVFSYILHFMSKTAAYDADVHNGGWIRSDTFSYFTFPTYELEGMTIGIIGYGSIGRKVAQIADAFGMKVIVSTRTIREDNIAEFVSQEELFRRSDIISLHCPLTAETEGLISMDKLKLCKPTAILINTARGPAVNEHDLAEALKQGIIAGAGLDVISSEPMKHDNPLMEAPNCVITPHVAWAPVQTRERLMKIVAENLRAYINGSPVNKVN